MAAQLTITKRLLLRYGNKLEQVLKSFRSENLEHLQVEVEDEARGSNLDKLRRLEEAVGAIKIAYTQVEKTLRDFTILVDTSKDVNTEDQEEYLNRAEELLAAAFDYELLLQARVHSFKSRESLQQERGRLRAFPLQDRALVGDTPVQQVELPALPIPRFTGNIWEWDNFWELYNANVHSRPLPELFKYNYLLNALEGEAKEAIQNFHVTKENYSKAIEFLVARYGNSEELIQRLIDRLEKIKGRSAALKDQRSLFEQLQVTVSQLRQKGEHVDSQWMIKKILSKFPEQVQRKILLKKQSLPSDCPFTMQALLTLIEETISTQEMMNMYIDKAESFTMQRTSSDKRTPAHRCMFCKGDHSPFLCYKFKTAKERANYLRDHKLCQLCASSQHKTTECKRRPCFKCQGPHHTSCCFKSFPAPEPAPTHASKTFGHNAIQKKPESKRIVKSKNTKGVNVVTEQNQVVDEDEQIFGGVHVSQEKDSSKSVFLPIGQLKVTNRAQNKLTSVPVLLDSGAELSFIDSKLADNLQLKTVGERTLSLHTFGSEHLRKKKCHMVEVSLYDEEGNHHDLQLLTHDVLTKPMKLPKLSGEDSATMASAGLKPPVYIHEGQIQPQILLGCDHIWKFWKASNPITNLPSGLHLIETQLGNVVTGQQTQLSQILQLQEQEEWDDKWDKFWSLEAQVNTLWATDNIGKEEEQWERFWTMENAGTQFEGPEEEEKREINKRVLDYFNKTIERRNDGYYVKLPWKENYKLLPDNKAIAHKRLVSLWNSLQKDTNLLEKYHEIFMDQLKLNIVEDVLNEEIVTGQVVHYIPHQAVQTPLKSTTKVRIVFDASTHYKGCLSLNQVLHQGPVILPDLYGIILRFRIGKIGIISDVEKAFLQVRLQESERDATRCLWLYDHRKPPTANNLRVLRCTRVTFGLISSPFLLAATTHFHLNTYKEDSNIVQEIKDNMYVDNVVLTEDTLEEATYAYKRSKQMFAELSMNLREFVSNEQSLMDVINNPDESNDLIPKVLGIRWDATADKFLLQCDIRVEGKVTKRTIASSIATIYDPLEWMTPLTHTLKVFLQSLWKENYSWDNELSEDKKRKWEEIVTNKNGFSKQLPRFISEKASPQKLVLFADASLEAMAACAYLCQDSSSNLIMAREKLPSIRSSITVPKLELNALTLALRLAKAVISQLHSTIKIKEINFWSDSQVVLKWLRSTSDKEKSRLVQNRIKEIRETVQHLNSLDYEVTFGYIQSELNPADCATRGMSKAELLKHMWWYGPAFLRRAENSTNSSVFDLPQDENETCQEEISAITTVQVKHHQGMESEDELITDKQAHTLSKAKRILAYVLRFIRSTSPRASSPNIKPRTLAQGIFPLPKPQEEEDISLRGDEIKYAEKVLIWHHQRKYITSIVLEKLKNLKVQTDAEEILRCRGRLGESDMEMDTKFPILVMQNSSLAQWIIAESHNKGHPGVNHTIAIIRRKFWIPRLRMQVLRYVRKCIVCQKTNNLPYKYPDQGDLPSERTIRSRPYQHVGLDYFGPLSIASTSQNGKCYGAIITCMVTRLIHLDVVTDLSMTAFLHMLRRFFARRGVPSTITSDNSSTFLLGETIINECIAEARKDPIVEREISNREIVWRHITPYAPWQGGFYERLIGSVKRSLSKTVGKMILSFEGLATVIAEIEALLNTRPLLYIDSSFDQDNISRPIDFLQKDLQVAFPFGSAKEDTEDPTYIPSSEIPILRTKIQTIQALESSCKLTEKFWDVWRTQYLTALREKYQVQLESKRSTNKTPKKGSLVLLHDDILPRYSWKMGRIEQVLANPQGIIREAEVILPSRKLVKRPLNRLVPLELDNDSEDDRQEEGNSNIIKNSFDEIRTVDNGNDHRETSHRYNLRPRNPKPRNETPERTSTGTSISCSQALSTIMTVCLLFTMAKASEITANTDSKPYAIHCIPGGVELYSNKNIFYEVCSEETCFTLENPKEKELIKFPPKVFLHEHWVQWKIMEGKTTQVIETWCAPAPFCDHINCTVCSALLFNPVCWPTGALLATAIIIYFIITGCYVFLHVPIVIGYPFRWVIGGIFRGLWHILWRAMKKSKEIPHRRPRNLVELLTVAAILALTIVAPNVKGCQQVDLFDHSATVCSNSDGTERCLVQISHVIKLNPFKRESCFRLVRNSSTIREIRASWKNAILTCEEITEVYTRDTEYHVIDSKRCPHAGSCTGNKCADINSSSLLPELEAGNKYPGNTACVESCGGPGCDCFYLSSGCLFYRIFAKPRTPQVLEIFHCNRWSEAAKIQFSLINFQEKKATSFTTFMRPNVPIKWNILSASLSSMTIPPIPTLDTSFITDGNNTAVWNRKFTPPLRCNSYEDAKSLTCPLVEDCTCVPAETKANCRCNEIFVTSWFDDLRNRLSIVTPFLSLRLSPEKTVQAVVQNMVTSEIVVTVKGRFSTEILVDSIACTTKADPIDSRDDELSSYQSVMTSPICTAKDLEEMLRNLWKEMESRFQQAKVMEIQVRHVKDTAVLKDAGAGEQVIFHSHNLRSLATIKQHLLRLETLYMLFDERYDYLANCTTEVSLFQREDWLNSEHGMFDPPQVSQAVSVQLACIDRLVKEVTDDLNQAEKNLKFQEMYFNDFRRCFPVQKTRQETELRELKEAFLAQKTIIENLMDRVAALEREQQTSRASDDQVSVSSWHAPSASSADSNRTQTLAEPSVNQPSSSNQIQVYPGRGPSSERIEESSVPPPEQSMGDLMIQLDEMETALRDFPYRALRDDPDIDPSIQCCFCGERGRHHSDSCQLVVDHLKRTQIIRKQGRCPRCLEFCGSFCKGALKRCWYCKKVEGTVWGYVVLKEPHHRAICPVPGLKGQLEEKARNLERGMRLMVESRREQVLRWWGVS